ncbi:MAG TPA: TIGR03000 domain-containing protein [Gemmataceae bacterium]|nr:TIGR03000 domain-containing protein [Gemmataceae bacterium]
MYSVVLMAAMTTTPVTPDFRKHGGGGCCGQAAAGCCGEVASCGCGGGHGGRMKGHKHHGGGGGCCGEVASCGGCGSGCGSACGGCAPVASCGCGGGYGGGYGGGMMAAPAPATAPGGAHPMPAPAPGAAPVPKTMANPNTATIVVNGAKDANVLIGGLVSAGNEDTRTMVSPDLDAGQVYHYDLTAEVIRDGQTVRLTRAITVKPGETTEVQLDFAGGSVVMK